MVDDAPTVRSLFEQALEVRPAAERAAFLDSACAGRPDLRTKVEALLRADADAGSFLASPVGSLPPTMLLRPISEGPGDLIGPYRLLQQIGEGGMGIVFMAEQTEPLQRAVALKIIKPGMDTRQVIARFEAERQALALMDHPNIAKVLDAGATSSGRPFFAMELVKGVPITAYCDERQLPLRNRLVLFRQVCQAVQHAHQKGVIHRDLKPNNVLVAEYDHQAVPKVIDFGVAKATGQKLTERTMFTEFGQVVGTLEYMSPEQAKLNQLDIDTRSDVYSLGVLLYELLTGSTPFKQKRLHEAAFDEMLRIIREEEPPKPSTRLSTTDLLPSIAANRSMEPLKLNRLLQGDLDWIVMKALEKDRSRRYETASAFATDVQRYLDDEAVQACPPSAAYRFRKFARRYKAALTTAALVCVVLVLGTLVSTWQAVRATRAEHRANAEAQRAKDESAIAKAVNEFLNEDLLGQANDNLPLDRYNAPSMDLKLLAVLNRAGDRIEGRFPDQPLVEAALRNTIGVTYRSFDENHANQSRAAKHLRRAVQLRQMHLGDEHPDTLASMASLALATGDVDLNDRVLEARRRVLGPDDPATLRSMFSVAYSLSLRGEKARALDMFREVLTKQGKVLGEDHASTAWTKHLVATVQRSLGGGVGPSGAHGEEIERLYREALSTMLKRYGDGSWHAFDVTLRLGQFLNAPGHYERAEAVFQDGYARLQAQPAALPEWSATLASELSALYRSRNQPKRAAEWELKRLTASGSALSRNSRLLEQQRGDPGLLLSRASLLIQVDRLGDAEAACLAALEVNPRDPDAAVQLQALANAHRVQRDWDKAAQLYRQAVAILRELTGADQELAASLAALAMTVRDKGDLAEAERVQREALAIIRKKRGHADLITARLTHDLAFLLMRIPGREAEAEQLYRQALDVRRQVLSEGDADVADSAFRLAQVLGNQGKFDEAEVLLRKTHASLAANVSISAREYEPVMLRWIVEQYRGWNKSEKAAEWERMLPPMELDKNHKSK